MSAAKDKIVFLLSTWMGTGLIPPVPGTMGTLGAIPLVILFSYAGNLLQSLLIILFVVISIWASEKRSKQLNQEDPSQVVIDEVAGFLVTLLFLSLTWENLILGFVLFRLFDIFKPFPIRKLERLKGGLGIVMDDLLAGVYANLCIRLILFFF
jgi:phosphatidylglycerophosphatase A